MVEQHTNASEFCPASLVSDDFLKQTCVLLGNLSFVVFFPVTAMSAAFVTLAKIPVESIMGAQCLRSRKQARTRASRKKQNGIAGKHRAR